VAKIKITIIETKLTGSFTANLLLKKTGNRVSRNVTSPTAARDQFELARPVTVALNRMIQTA
jgi:hypothetical protein